MRADKHQSADEGEGEEREREQRKQKMKHERDDSDAQWRSNTPRALVFRERVELVV